MSKQWLAIGLMSFGLAAVAASPARAEDKKGEEKEVKVAIADVPAAVRKTIKREAPDAKITTVDLEEKDGKSVYEVDAVIDGTNYEIIISKDGKLLSKSVDEEPEEKAGEKKASEKKEGKGEKAEGAKKGKKVEKEEDDDEKPAKKAKAAKKDKDEDDDKK